MASTLRAARAGLSRRRQLRAFSAVEQRPELPYCSSSDEHPHGTYPHLFAPLTLPCGLTLRNRTLMGSMHTGLEEHHDADGGLGRMAAFYGERAAGGAGIIVTGGVAPNREGWVLPMAGKMSTAKEAAQHACVTEAVHDAGGLIAMQILHAGRYAYHPMAVAPSKKKAPINVITPRALSDKDIRRTIDDFARCAELAKSCGYDGVEIMGSEGYFINEFLAPRTNVRDDDWGGSFENRSRLALEIMKAVRAAVGVEDFAVIFRVSMLELVENGLSFDESVELSAALHAAGVDIINTGIGWHEARVPTIATCVPRGAFAFATRNVKDALDAKAAHPLLCATNRINDAATAERILARGDADLVSLARPFLADENIVRKAWEGAEAETNTCIGCNQACLDHTFKLVPVSCLVNPRAGHETLLNLEQAPAPQRVAVVGAGPAGPVAGAWPALAAGHAVTLFEASDRRKKSALGAGLGKTTGWIHRAALRQRGVEFVRGCEYVSVEDDGFHAKVDGRARARRPPRTPPSRGQVSVNDLYDETDVDAFLIGGAQKAGELDAKRAIDQGYRLAGAIETAEPGAVLEMPVGWRASALKMRRDAMGRNSA
ncbi:L-glutamate synthase [Aureococcus anophagefferens]|uniref:L-glutamate synthase n=1 Tax=Aureococcus anophagefferens TaxID=44056 RepID=A0ABR1G9I5_AURAN